MTRRQQLPRACEVAPLSRQSPRLARGGGAGEGLRRDRSSRAGGDAGGGARGGLFGTEPDEAAAAGGRQRLKAAKLFGTDGVRGTANVHPMTAEVALALGQAVAHVFASSRRDRTQIIIGKDTRLSGYLFEDALAAGICSMGADVIQVGPMPTPGMAFPDGGHALRRGRHDLRQPQSVSGQRHQVLLERRFQAARRGGGADREPGGLRGACRPASGAGRGGPGTKNRRRNRAATSCS